MKRLATVEKGSHSKQLPLDLAAPLPSEKTRSRAGARSALDFLPRFIRFRDAPRFLGMDKNRFNREVRPSLAEIPIGKQGVAFDRLELELAAEDYKRRNGRPAAQRRKP
jgi:hypothetical protein